jgi:capsular polysaccharide biosynthesis protein
MEAPTDLLAVLVRSWRIVAAVCLAGLAGGLLLAVASPPRYDATALVVVVPTGTESGGGTEAVSYAQAYARVTTTPALLAPALRDSGLDPAHPGTSVRASSSSNTPVVEIVASGRRAAVSTDVANAVADQLMSYSGTVGQSTGYTVRLFARATVPTAPSSRGAALNGVLGATLGLILGGILAVVRDAFRTRRPTGEETEEEQLEAFLRSTRAAPLHAVDRDRDREGAGGGKAQRSRPATKRDAKGRYVRTGGDSAPDDAETPAPMNRRQRRALARETAKKRAAPGDAPDDQARAR